MADSRRVRDAINDAFNELADIMSSEMGQYSRVNNAALHVSMSLQEALRRERELDTAIQDEERRNRR